MSKNFQLCAYWYNRPMTANEYVAALKEYLIILKSHFPLFSDFHIVTGNGSKPISVESEHFAADVVEMLPPDSAYINPGNPSNREFAMTSLPAVAFINAFTNGPNPGPHPVCVVNTLMGRTSDKPNNIVIEFTHESESVKLFDAIFRETVLFWKPNHAILTRSLFDEILDQPIGDIRVGWLTYIKGEEAARHVPPPCKAEPFSEGALIHTSEDVPSHDGIEIIPTLKLLRDALGHQGLLKNPRKKLATP